jgi:hypothetical protein
MGRRKSFASTRRVQRVESSQALLLAWRRIASQHSTEKAAGKASKHNARGQKEQHEKAKKKKEEAAKQRKKKALSEKKRIDELSTQDREAELQAIYEQNAAKKKSRKEKLDKQVKSLDRGRAGRGRIREATSASALQKNY